MKVKRKGNVYPFLSSPSTSSTSSYKDPDSVLKLLPVTILTLAFSLPNQDREVLAYLISRSIVATTTTSPCSSLNKCSTTGSSGNGKSKSVKKLPPFECGCFDCYTGFWHRWDSSPNRELIHQVIEAFEEHLLINESPSKHNNRGGKKRSNSSKRVEVIKQAEKKLSEKVVPVVEDESEVVMMMPKKTDGVVCREHEAEEEKMGIDDEVTKNLEMEVVTVQAMRLGANYNKGFARKVLPDVVGLLNSRLWSLWSPGI